MFKSYTYPWPTQLLIQGQWWSNRPTHLLQMLQWRLRGFLITSHSGHRETESNRSRRSRKSREGSGLRNPGSLSHAIRHRIRLVEKVIWQIVARVDTSSSNTKKLRISWVEIIKVKKESICLKLLWRL